MPEETFSTELVCDTTMADLCGSCYERWGEVLPHDIVSMSLWRQSILAALAIHAPVISINRKFIAQIVAAGTSKAGFAVTEDPQCIVCDRLHGSLSLLQRTRIAQSEEKPLEFVGMQFQHATTEMMQSFTKMKIEMVARGYLLPILKELRDSDSGLCAGDDLHTMVMDDHLLEAFIANLEQITWESAL